MKPTKTPLLSELCFAYRERNPELFLNESKSADRLRNYLEEFLQDEEQEKQVVFSNTLGVYANEFYYMGYIDGFKVCKWLMEELELTRDKDFLKELLIEDIEDIPLYWEYQIKPDKGGIQGKGDN